MSTTNLPPSSEDYLLPQALPPRCMQTDDRAEADRARRKARSLPTRRFLSLPSLRKHRRKTSPGDVQETGPTAVDSVAPTDGADEILTVGEPVDLDNSQDVDVYRWAVLYENQRGFTFLGGPYYSCLSLLPNDPPPYTIPEPNPHARQPKCSLTEYPLPDGNWRWVSRDWMIDMRGEGAVQHDGFEYNWFFRRHHWRAEVGRFSAGGLVRRRRWVRLMVKPAAKRQNTSQSLPNTPSLGWTEPSRTHSVVSSGTSDVGTSVIGEVWLGDVDADWIRCRALMRRVGRDGRRLELWKTWLSAYLPVEGDDQRRAKQWTEDSTMMPSEVEYADQQQQAKPPLEVDKQAIAAVIRVHGKDVIDSMIYPETRAKFVELLARAGLLPDLTSGLGMSQSDSAANLVGFWSYSTLLEDSGH